MPGTAKESDGRPHASKSSHHGKTDSTDYVIFEADNATIRAQQVNLTVSAPGLVTVQAEGAEITATTKDLNVGFRGKDIKAKHKSMKALAEQGTADLSLKAATIPTYWLEGIEPIVIEVSPAETLRQIFDEYRRYSTNPSVYSITKESLEGMELVQLRAFVKAFLPPNKRGHK